MRKFYIVGRLTFLFCMSNIFLRDKKEFVDTLLYCQTMVYDHDNSNSPHFLLFRSCYPITSKDRKSSASIIINDYLSNTITRLLKVQATVIGLKFFRIVTIAYEVTTDNTVHTCPFLISHFSRIERHLRETKFH